MDESVQIPVKSEEPLAHTVHAQAIIAAALIQARVVTIDGGTLSAGTDTAELDKLRRCVDRIYRALGGPPD
jgi:hypothetical protein